MLLRSAVRVRGHVSRAAAARALATSRGTGEDLVTLAAWSPDQILETLELAAALKQRIGVENDRSYRPLEGHSLATIFQKRSTRTRVSTETGFALLGGHALFLSADDIQLGASESLEDTAKVLSRFNDAILARVFAHADVEALAAHASVPVVNALSDLYHPLQILADLQTLRERFGRPCGLRVAWVGDGNNVLHSYMAACPKLGIDLAVATPSGYEPDEGVRCRFDEECSHLGATGLFTDDPREAVEGAHVVVTDTWVSMGQEEDKARRLHDFAGYQVTHALCERADPEWVFLHCLPRYPYEVDDAVFGDARRSLVFDAAENRMWTVMAVLHRALVGATMVA